MSETTTLYFGSRPYDAKTARDAADRLRAKPFGYTVAERHAEGGEYIVETNAPRKIALDVKARARAQHRREILAATTEVAL